MTAPSDQPHVKRGMEMNEKHKYRYEEDVELQACVAAASKAWREAFAAAIRQDRGE